LSDFVTDLISLRKNYSVFTTTGTAQITNGSTLVQQITLKNAPYTETPKDSTQMNVQVVANMDVVSQQATINFPHAGTWYEYYSNGAPITGSSILVTLAPGDYKLYTDVPIKGSHLVTEVKKNADIEVTLYPNPTHDQVHVETSEPVLTLHVRSVTGMQLSLYQVDDTTWDCSSLSPGLYIVEVKTPRGVTRKKLIVK